MIDERDHEHVIEQLEVACHELTQALEREGHLRTELDELRDAVGDACKRLGLPDGVDATDLDDAVGQLERFFAGKELDVRVEVLSGVAAMLRRLFAYVGTTFHLQNLLTHVRGETRRASLILLHGDAGGSPPDPTDPHSANDSPKVVSTVKSATRVRATRALSRLDVDHSRLDKAVELYGWDSGEVEGCLVWLCRDVGGYVGGHVAYDHVAQEWCALFGAHAWDHRTWGDCPKTAMAVWLEMQADASAEPDP